MKDLAAYYNGMDPEPLVRSYVDYAVWQREYFHGENGVSEAHLKWWEKGSSGASALVRELATDHVRTSGPARSAHFDIKIETALGSAVARAAKQMEVTNFSLLMSTFGLLMGTHARSTDLLVCTPTSGRKLTELFLW